MDIMNPTKSERLDLIKAHQKNIARYEKIISDINQDKKGERKLVTARISTIIEKEVFLNCDITAFSDEFLELINESCYDNAHLNTVSEFSTAIISDSDIDLKALMNCFYFNDFFDKASESINDDSEIDLSSDNTTLVLEVQRAFDEMTPNQQLEVIGFFDFQSYYEPNNYFIISDYLADKLRSIGQSVAEWGNFNIMINCAWSLTDNSEIVAIAETIEYDVGRYVKVIENCNTVIGELRQE